MITLLIALLIITLVSIIIFQNSLIRDKNKYIKENKQLKEFDSDCIDEFCAKEGLK